MFQNVADVRLLIGAAEEEGHDAPVSVAADQTDSGRGVDERLMPSPNKGEAQLWEETRRQVREVKSCGLASVIGCHEVDGRIMEVPRILMSHPISWT